MNIATITNICQPAQLTKIRLRRRVDLATLVNVSRSNSNVPAAALRWSVERAGIEFGLTSQTLRRSLAKTSAAPDADGLYSTKQIVAAIYGAFDQERLLTQKELTRKYAIANAVAESRFLDKAELMKGLAGIADAMTHRILASELSRAAKEDLLRDLASVPIMLKEVAEAQTNFPRRNGQTIAKRNAKVNI